MMLFNQWMISKQEGKSVVDYFHMKDIHTIAIYGLSFVGKRLKDELNGSDIEVKYAIDKNADNIFSDIDVIFPSDGMPDVDAIIVTPVFFYEQIKEELEQLTQTPIISMNDILYEV